VRRLPPLISAPPLHQPVTRQPCTSRPQAHIVSCCRYKLDAHPLLITPADPFKPPKVLSLTSMFHPNVAPMKKNDPTGTVIYGFEPLEMVASGYNIWSPARMVRSGAK
jgi:hypothetical protein